MNSAQMVNDKAVTEFMKSQGFEYFSYYDDNACHAAPVSGGIWYFINTKTGIVVSFSFGNYDDDMLFGDDVRDEILDKYPDIKDDFSNAPWLEGEHNGN